MLPDQRRLRVAAWSSLCADRDSAAALEQRLLRLLAANNLVLVLDLVVWPELDLRLARLVLALAAIMSLIWGFVWDVEEE